MYEHATATRGTDDLEALLAHPDTIYAAAAFAKHIDDSFSRVMKDETAFYATPGRGIVHVSKESLSITAGCPEVSAVRTHHGITVTPTKLFGEFVRWTGGLYIAASSYEQTSTYTAHARKDTPPLV